MDASAQPSDTFMSEAAPVPPSQSDLAPAGIENILATLSHGGRFIQYNIFGNIFEVTAKYKPPIMPIGKGAYGIVCSALNSETNEHVAIKKIANAFDNKIDAKRTLREIKLLRHMDHENVVAIRDIIPPPQRESFNDVYIAYELMDTDLHQIIRSNQSLSEEHCQYFLYQILRGLKYIHSANVLHRDLKPSNLLLNANCDLKICDFGLARVTSETDFMTEYVVTRWYRAPELLLNSSDYTAAIDVWSVGCIFMELMDRKPLFQGRDHVHQLRLLMELIGTPSEAEFGFLNENAKRYIRQLPPYRRQSLTEKFPHVHHSAIDLIEKMLTFDPRQRITVEDALAHPYLTSLHDISEQNGVGSVPFDRSTSLRYLNNSNSRRQQGLPRSSSSRTRSLTDPLLHPHQLVNQDQDVKVDDLETKHFILVHGGGFGAWCWYKTIALLEEVGFKVTAVDLTGFGIHSFDTNNISSLSQYVKPLTDILDNLADGEKVILVGHDFGGACVSYAMELFPSRISKAVFVAAAMLISGQSALDMFSQKDNSNDLMRQAQIFRYANGNDQPPTAIDLGKSLLGDLLFNQSPAKDIALASVSMRSIPFSPVLEKLSISDEKYGSVRRFYIETPEDNAIPIQLQVSMINRSPPERVFRLKGADHSPFFSRPQTLHKQLVEIAKMV